MSTSIKKLRIERGVSQQELADLLEITRQTFSKLEN
jgi:DNA-binding XRE family transcriptional regulator